MERAGVLNFDDNDIAHRHNNAHSFPVASALSDARNPPGVLPFTVIKQAGSKETKRPDAGVFCVCCGVIRKSHFSGGVDPESIFRFLVRACVVVSAFCSPRSGRATGHARPHKEGGCQGGSRKPKGPSPPHAPGRGHARPRRGAGVSSRANLAKFLSCRIDPPTSLVHGEWHGKGRKKETEPRNTRERALNR